MFFGPFLKNANGIYDKNFRKAVSEVHKRGVIIDPVLATQTAGLGVCLRYPKEFTDKLVRFGERVAACTGAVSLGEHMHTTIRMDAKPGFVFSPAVHQLILDQLSVTIRRVLQSLKRGVAKDRSINFGPALFNQKAVVLPGTPSLSYFEFLKAINEEVLRLLPNAPDPWGAHITIARFAKSQLSFELEEFFTLMHDTPRYSLIVPDRIDVTYSQVTPDHQIIFKTFDSIPLT